MRLEIQPLPKSTWNISLSHKLPKEEWDYLRHECYKSADYKCEICGAKDTTLFAHEVWSFDDKKLIQRLTRLECCCIKCSDVHHFGRSSIVYDLPRIEELIRHWCRVNKLTFADFMRHRDEMNALSIRRANKKYIVKAGRRIL